MVQLVRSVWGEDIGECTMGESEPYHWGSAMRAVNTCREPYILCWTCLIMCGRKYVESKSTEWKNFKWSCTINWDTLLVWQWQNSQYVIQLLYTFIGWLWWLSDAACPNVWYFVLDLKICIDFLHPGLAVVLHPIWRREQSGIEPIWTLLQMMLYDSECVFTKLTYVAWLAWRYYKPGGTLDSQTTEMQWENKLYQKNNMSMLCKSWWVRHMNSHR